MLIPMKPSTPGAGGPSGEFTDFDEYTPGGNLTTPPSGFLEPLSSQITYNIDSNTDTPNPSGGNLMWMHGVNAPLALARRTELGSTTAEVELFGLIYTEVVPTVGSTYGLIVLADDGAETGYIVGFTRSTSTTTRIVFGYWISDATHDVIVPLVSASATVHGTWYCVRLYTNGTNFKVRVWPETDSEPAAWDYDGTPTEGSPSGRTGHCGLGFIGENGAGSSKRLACAFLGWGVDPESAPTHE